MAKRCLKSLLLAAGVLASGCAVLEPSLPAAEPPIPAEWPLPPTTTEAAAAAATADIGWRDFFTDPRLEAVIERALANNRDLRVAVLNIERARAQYGIQRADRLPSLGANATLARTGGSDRPVTDIYTADLAITEFELDLFGRVRNLSESALQRYFAQEEARRSVQLALIAEVANAYLNLAANQEQVAKRYELGAESALELSLARTQVETARAETARYAGLVAQDKNALNLLVGAPLEPELLPEAFDESVTGLGALPAGLPSEVLLRRPDVLAAEHQLLAANANIGAARAAFFPKITLTGAVGTTSDELSGLFDSGTGIWSFLPKVEVPIFEGGRLRSSLGVATADRDIALAQYEQAIQVGFREVADALALTGTLAEQRAARQAAVEAAAEGDRLSRARYRAGRDNYLVLLEAQRSLYLAQQSLVATQLAEQANRVTLYKVLGGGWRQGGP
ncbi:MAG: efflux transporter outer membrane subunit [Burkholderiaceae bacterium]|nr:efflux transporter outer membrane subunit [Burkholderiaceae bacterium]